MRVATERERLPTLPMVGEELDIRWFDPTTANLEPARISVGEVSSSPQLYSWANSPSVAARDKFGFGFGFQRIINGYHRYG